MGRTSINSPRVHTKSAWLLENPSRSWSTYKEPGAGAGDAGAARQHGATNPHPTGADRHPGALENTELNQPDCKDRMVGVWSNLRKSPGPTPLLKQVQLELVPQDCLQVACEYLQGRRLHGLSGQTVLVLSHPHSKEAFPHIQVKLPVSLCASIFSRINGFSSLSFSL